MEAVLDFSLPVDVGAFDALVQESQDGAQREHAQAVLQQFLVHPDAYTRIDVVLSESKSELAHFFALSALLDTIQGRWHILPAEQQTGIRDFLVGFILERCTSVQAVRANRMVLNKANAALVAIAKREWPGAWPTFVQEIVASAQHGPATAENAIAILITLIEEVFQFGEKNMTARWIDRKKKALAEDFTLVWDLCGQLLMENDTTLVLKVLECVERAVPVVPVDLVYNLGFLSGIAGFLENGAARIAALKVMTEIADVPVAPGKEDIVTEIYDRVLTLCVAWLPAEGETLADKVQVAYALSEEEGEFVNVLCLFCTRFLQRHLPLLGGIRDAVVAAHNILNGCLYNNDKETFRTCVEYAWWLADFLKCPRANMKGTAAQLHALLRDELSMMRLGLVSHMAKPEEVVLVEDELGELQNEYLTDVEALNLYITMREALVLLTHLDPQDMQNLMRRLMQQQQDRSEYSWSKLNVLCWSFGAISGALSADAEKNAFVAFLRDLLGLCEKMQAREDRAVIASGIMYVVGQYPRFLNAHPRFLRTIIGKNVEFMKERFPGVKDMAVDTIVKVLRNCSAMLWDESAGGFAKEMLSNVDFYTAELNQSQIAALFEGMGHIVSCAPRPDGGPALLTLLAGPNAAWATYVAEAGANGPECLAESDALKSLVYTLRCINRAAKSCGMHFIVEMQQLFWDLQNFYVFFSGLLAEIAAGTDKGMRFRSSMHYLRVAKKEMLKTVEYFLLSTEDKKYVSEQIIPQLFSTLLSDYAKAPVPAASDPNVINVMTACIKCFRGHMNEGVPHILDALFGPTALLITEHPAEYPEHRQNLFDLVREVTKYCFDSFVEYVREHTEVVDGLLWAAKHVDKNTCHAGLDAINDFAERVSWNEEASGWFLELFGTRMVEETLIAMLDTMHKPAFHRQVSLFSTLFKLATNVEGGAATLQQCIAGTLAQIPTLTEVQVNTFTEQCPVLAPRPLDLRALFADLMIEVQVWGAEQETADAKAAEQLDREANIEGFARPDIGAGERYQQLNAQDDDAV